jgi:hypothetical protein
MIQPFLVSWEAESLDGSVLRERDGAKYGEIDRSNLKSFRLVSPGEILLEAPMKDGRTGRDLCYRRRTRISHGIGDTPKDVWFLIGFVPMGPVMALNPMSMEYQTALRFGTDSQGLFAAPTPHPDEGEHFVFEAAGHTTDAVLKPTHISVRGRDILV